MSQSCADETFGTKLDKTMVMTVKYPKEAFPSGAYSNVDSVVGQTTKVFMAAREPVTATKLSSQGGGSAGKPGRSSDARVLRHG